MKRIPILLLCLLLALSGCAAGTTGAEEAADTAETTDTAVTADAAGTEDTGETAEETADTEETAEAAEAADTAEEPEETADTADAGETEHAVTVDAGETEHAVTVDIQPATETITAEDGTELAEVTTLTVTVSVEGDPEVEESINADLRQLTGDVSEDAQTFAGAAREDYDYAQEEGQEWAAYASGMTAEVTRCDGRVLSLRFEGYQYTGGVHGYSYTFGRSYDLSSGSRLTLDHLSDQGVSFREYALEQIAALAQSEDFAALLYEGVGQEDLEAVVTDASFYFTDEAIVFAADPYVVGPYASGVIQFPLAYSDLAGVVRAEYLP